MNPNWFLCPTMIPWSKRYWGQIRKNQDLFFQVSTVLWQRSLELWENAGGIPFSKLHYHQVKCLSIKLHKRVGGTQNLYNGGGGSSGSHFAGKMMITVCKNPWCSAGEGVQCRRWLGSLEGNMLGATLTGFTLTSFTLTSCTLTVFVLTGFTLTCFTLKSLCSYKFF